MEILQAWHGKDNNYNYKYSRFRMKHMSGKQLGLPALLKVDCFTWDMEGGKNLSGKRGSGPTDLTHIDAALHKPGVATAMDSKPCWQLTSSAWMTGLWFPVGTLCCISQLSWERDDMSWNLCFYLVFQNRPLNAYFNVQYCSFQLIFQWCKHLQAKQIYLS